VKAEPASRRGVDPLGGLFIALASLQFGGVVVLGKIVTRSGLPVSSYLSIRFAVAAFLLAVVLAATKQPLLAAKGEGWRLALLGMAGYAVEAGLFFSALQRGTAAAVTLLFYTYPVIVTLVAAATGKGLPGRLVVAALALSLAGAAIVVVAGAGLVISASGVLFALGSAGTISLFLLGLDAVLRGTNSLTASLWVSGAAAVALAAFALASGSGQWPVGARQWAPVVACGVFTAGAFACLFGGLRRLGPVRTSIVSASEPLAATVLAVMFLSEPLRAATLAGGVLILGGAVAASVARREPALEPPVP